MKRTWRSSIREFLRYSLVLRGILTIASPGEPSLGGQALAVSVELLFEHQWQNEALPRLFYDTSHQYDHLKKNTAESVPNTNIVACVSAEQRIWITIWALFL